MSAIGRWNRACIGPVALLHAHATIWTRSLPLPTARSPSSAAAPSGPDPEFEAFCAAAAGGANVVPLYRRLLSDQLTPVTVYRCLVQENDVNAPSFLLESVVNGDQTGRYSFVGAMPALEVVATQGRVTVLNHAAGTRRVTEEEDPMEVGPRGAHGDGVQGRGGSRAAAAARIRAGEPRRALGPASLGAHWGTGPRHAGVTSVRTWVRARMGPGVPPREQHTDRATPPFTGPGAAQPQLAAGAGGGPALRLHGRLGGLRRLRHRAVRIQG